MIPLVTTDGNEKTYWEWLSRHHHSTSHHLTINWLSSFEIEFMYFVANKAKSI